MIGGFLTLDAALQIVAARAKSGESRRKKNPKKEGPCFRHLKTYGKNGGGGENMFISFPT